MRLLPIAAIVWLLLANGLAAQTPATGTPPVETYQSVAIDAQGNLAITTTDGRTIVVPKEGEQRSFSAPKLSADRTAVGAQALFPNCCTSYDIPLQLVVYAAGKMIRFTGDGRPIFEWHFANAGTRIAYGQQPVHFGCSVHYELWDIPSLALIDWAYTPVPCSQILEPEPVNVPAWVWALVDESNRRYRK